MQIWEEQKISTRSGLLKGQLANVEKIDCLLSCYFFRK